MILRPHPVVVFTYGPLAFKPEPIGPSVPLIPLLTCLVREVFISLRYVVIPPKSERLVNKNLDEVHKRTLNLQVCTFMNGYLTVKDKI